MSSRPSHFGCNRSAQQELSHKLAVLREQATQLGLKHERYKTAARLNEEISAEVEALLRKMEQRTKVTLLLSEECCLFVCAAALSLFVLSPCVPPTCPLLQQQI